MQYKIDGSPGDCSNPVNQDRNCALITRILKEQTFEKPNFDPMLLVGHRGQRENDKNIHNHWKNIHSFFF
jgi:hypothetical protein